MGSEQCKGESYDDDDDDDDDYSKVNNLQTRSKRPEFESFKSEREDPTYDFSEREKTDGKGCLKTFLSAVQCKDRQQRFSF